MRSWTDGRRTRGGDGGREWLRPLRRFWLLGLGLTSAAGCGGARAGIEQSSAPSGGTVITADKIAASGAKTAWDAVRMTVPNVQLRENRGRPSRIQRRGRASIYLDDQVRVMVDNVRMLDITVLDQIPAGDILTIEVLTGLDATTYYGGSSTSGLIIIRTKTGSE
jgi:outer membrane cobalamin receptor